MVIKTDGIRKDMDKENDINVLIKLRFQRDIIFDAKYKNQWLYRSNEAVAFEWMRLVSGQLQSMDYPPRAFLKDLETFSLAVHRMIGTEREKTKVFDNLVMKVRDQWSSDTDNEGLCNKEEGEGVTDLFQNAVFAATAGINDDLDRHTNTFSFCPSSSQTAEWDNDTPLVEVSEGNLEEVAERGRIKASSILRSLYEHGYQHGNTFVIEDKKQKERKDIGNRNKGHYPSQYMNASAYISSSRSKRQHSQISIHDLNTDTKSKNERHIRDHRLGVNDIKRPIFSSDERTSSGLEKQFKTCYFSLKNTDSRCICDRSKLDFSNKMRSLTQVMRLRAESWLFKKIGKVVKLPENCVVCSKCYSLISYHKA
jgi:hypothetical protein